MATVLLTGGTGVLGSELRPRLLAAGYTVRVMSRRAAEDGDGGWARADLLTGAGLPEAVSGVDTVVHCASSPRSKTREIDVEGTRRLIETASAAGRPRLLYVSIVGVDRIPFGYYKAKLAAEKLAEQSPLPCSVLRATQFHTLIDMFLSILVRLPVALLPTSFRFQPIDAGEVADCVVEHVAKESAGRLPDIGGPEVRSFGDLTRAWLKARGKRAAIVPLPLPGKVAGGFRRGFNCTENAYGKVTWEQWLESRYGGAR